MLNHIALGATDVEKVSAFYRDILGLPELDRHDNLEGELRSVWLDLGGPILMIERSSESPRRVEGVGAGPFLLAIDIDTEKREAIETRLVDAGATIESRTEYTSYTRDPEGNRVAVSHYPRLPENA